MSFLFCLYCVHISSFLVAWNNGHIMSLLLIQLFCLLSKCSVVHTHECVSFVCVYFHGCRQHYPGASSPDAALRLDKILWASEEYSTFNNIHGGGCWARVCSQSFLI